MPRIVSLLFVALALWLASASALVAAPRIGVVTMQPGEEYWARFGHNAILVAPENGAEPTLYNFGYFDFDEPGFLLHFLQGRMRYRLVALPMHADLANYAAEGRGVRLQWLDLDPDTRQKLADHLAWRARPENAVYRYDYFTRNCSTEVRDSLNEAMGGTLKKQIEGRSRGLSYRSEALRLGEPEWWLYLGMSAGLGPFADTSLSRWTESFVPERFSEALREVHNIEGRPLVSAEQQLVDDGLPNPPPYPPQWRWRFIGVGVLLGALLWLLLAPKRPLPLRAAGTVLTGLLWTTAGLGGLLLAWLWMFSEHIAAWANQNLLQFDPLALLLLAALPAFLRGRPAGRALRLLGWIVLIGSGVGMFFKFLPFLPQQNVDWIGLWMPIHAALMHRLSWRPETSETR